MLLAALVAAVGCTEVTSPEDEAGREESDLTFVQLAANAEAEVTQASFWAVRGQSRTLEVRYLDGAGGDSALLRFTVGAQSLLMSPDAQPYLPGDSVRITVNLDTQRRFIFHFEPSGLVFSPVAPAQLRINYSGAAGVSAPLELQLRVWRQELPGLPWLPLPTMRVTGSSAVEAQVLHFTGFALAS